MFLQRVVFRGYEIFVLARHAQAHNTLVRASIARRAACTAFIYCTNPVERPLLAVLGRRSFTSDCHSCENDLLEVEPPHSQVRRSPPSQSPNGNQRLKPAFVRRSSNIAANAVALNHSVPGSGSSVGGDFGGVWVSEVLPGAGLVPGLSPGVVGISGVPPGVVGVPGVTPGVVGVSEVPPDDGLVSAVSLDDVGVLGVLPAFCVGAGSAGVVVLVLLPESHLLGSVPPLELLALLDCSPSTWLEPPSSLPNDTG